MSEQDERLPWRTDDPYPDIIKDTDGEEVASVGEVETCTFIVLACNNFDRLTRENEAMRKALEAVEQRANESGIGEMSLIDTIHAMARITRIALASLKEPVA